MGFPFTAYQGYFTTIMQEAGKFHFAAQTRQMQVLERPGKDMHIEFFAVLGQTAILWGAELALGATVNRGSMAFHPVAIDTQGFEGARVESAERSRTDVHQQVAAARDGINQQHDELLRAFPGIFVTMIAPGAAKGLAGFPDDRLTVHA